MDTTLATRPSGATISLLVTLLTLLIPVISAFLTKWFVNLLKRTSAAVDNTSPLVKQLLVLVISTVLTLAFNYFGLTLTGTATLTGLNDADVQALISAALAMILHHADKLNALQTGPRNFSQSAMEADNAGHAVRKESKRKDY